ncbi:MAG: TraR/DksA C4-type zinc finger protein [bacterium]|nr:TraR/DksA C4-type zinc finger protein [bacterium]
MAVIPVARLRVISEAKLCVACQGKVERGLLDLDAHQRNLAGLIEHPEPKPLQIQEDRLVVGTWSGGFLEVAVQSGKMRELLRSGNKEEAKALVQSLPIEAQAALVVVDEDPEEALSMTGMDGRGNPGYRADVVSLLPTEMLTGLIAYDGEEKRFNTRLIQAMTPSTFNRTVCDTLEPVDNAEARAAVTWEWLEALAEVVDVNKRAELLRSVETEILEEALITRIHHFNLNDKAASVEIDGEQWGVDMFRIFSEDSAVGPLPSKFIEDVTVGTVMDALYEAAPDVMSAMVRGAWERQFDGWEDLE